MAQESSLSGGADRERRGLSEGLNGPEHVIRAAHGGSYRLNTCILHGCHKSVRVCEIEELVWREEPEIWFPSATDEAASSRRIKIFFQLPIQASEKAVSHSECASPLKKECNSTTCDVSMQVSSA